ncbi:MAG: DUF4058 family protein [Planctomycetaceae bacterium]
MPSPFPGMDPYLEAHWGDVHSSLVLYARDMLRQQLPRDLYARVEERVFVETDDDVPGVRVPDVRIVEHHRTPDFGSPGAAQADEEGGVATITAPEPEILELSDEPITERFIEIRDASTGHRIVTVIEVLSLANKHPGEGREAYLRKQSEHREAGVSLVEIDLLRSGTTTLPAAFRRFRVTRSTPYRVSVWRGTKPNRVEFYAISLRQPLPSIRIPLRETDEDVRLDLQALLIQTYENGSYALTTDYKQSSDPPLSEEDAAWAAKLMNRHQTT